MTTFSQIITRTHSTATHKSNILSNYNNYTFLSGSNKWEKKLRWTCRVDYNSCYSLCISSKKKSVPMVDTICNLACSLKFALILWDLSTDIWPLDIVKFEDPVAAHYSYSDSFATYKTWLPRDLHLWFFQLYQFAVCDTWWIQVRIWYDHRFISCGAFCVWVLRSSVIFTFDVSTISFGIESWEQVYQMWTL